MNTNIEKNFEVTQKLSDELKWRLTFEKDDLTDRFESLDASYIELKSKLQEIGGMAVDSAEEFKVIF